MQEVKMIEITERKCSPKIQRNIGKGMVFTVVGTDTLKDGTPVVIVNDGNGKESRINANRFSWKEVSVRDCIEKRFKEDCRETSEQLRNNFTVQEHIQIAIVPCILANIAFRYGDKVRKAAAEQRISILKHLSRAYDTLKQSYLRELSLDLDTSHISNIDNQTAVFMKTYSNDFQILWYSVHAEFKKKMNDFPYSEMRTDAICGMLVIDMARQMIDQFDEMIRERIANAKNTIFNPKIAALRDILDAYAGEVGKFDFNEYNCQLSLKVIKNRLLQIEFDVE